MNEINSNIITVNLDSYLAEFLVGYLGCGQQPIPLSKKNFIGTIIYRMLEKVPENCIFTPPVIKRKVLLQLQLSSLGTQEEERKRAFTHYYFPLSRQKDFEAIVRDMFNELFFQIIEITKSYTEVQYIRLIESFCIRYNIDFAKHFDMLKKKHYRARLTNVKTSNNFTHESPVNFNTKNN